MATTRDNTRRRQQARLGCVRSGGGGHRRDTLHRRRRIAWGVVGAAGALALSSRTMRRAFQAAATANALRLCVPWLATAVDIIAFVLDPAIASRVWDLVRTPWQLVRGLPRELWTSYRDVAEAHRFHPAVRTRVSGRADQKPVSGASVSEDARRLVRGAIDEELDGECGICTTKLTPENLVVMSCCVPERVGGRVHVVCARCWDRMPEPKNCPHCRRRVERCAPADMVRRIREV